MKYLIVGLGNIGPEYALTRHNMGFMVLDSWAAKDGFTFKNERYGDVAEIKYKGRTLVLLKPSTYMNLSGNAVRYWVNKLKLPLEKVLIICDDLNLPYGALRMKKKGSAGGHNGLQNIQDLLASSQYPRIRIGIGNDFSRGAQCDFVTGGLSDEEMDEIPNICKNVIGGIKSFVFIGPDRTMNSFNTKKVKKTPVKKVEENIEENKTLDIRDLPEF